MSLPAPADLRVLCRILTSSAPEDLPRLCRALVGHVSRCAGPLSAHQDGKGKDKLSEAASLVHKLRTRITALLQGKSAPGRFAAVVLVKAVVDVGGWECLRTSEAWIAGLLSVVRVGETEERKVKEEGLTSSRNRMRLRQKSWPLPRS